MKNMEVQVIRRSPLEVRAGAKPYVVYLNGEFWCDCTDIAVAKAEIAALKAK